jgi:hypothetical protein
MALKAPLSNRRGGFMHKIITKETFILTSSVRKRGFGVAAFHFEDGKPAGDKMSGLPEYPPQRALHHGRKS